MYTGQEVLIIPQTPGNVTFMQHFAKGWGMGFRDMEKPWCEDVPGVAFPN